MMGKIGAAGRLNGWANQKCAPVAVHECDTARRDSRPNNKGQLCRQQALCIIYSARPCLCGRQCLDSPLLSTWCVVSIEAAAHSWELNATITNGVMGLHSWCVAARVCDTQVRASAGLSTHGHTCDLQHSSMPKYLVAAPEAFLACTSTRDMLHMLCKCSLSAYRPSLRRYL